MYQAIWQENLDLKEQLKELQEAVQSAKIAETYEQESASFTQSFREPAYNLLGLHMVSPRIPAVASPLFNYLGVPYDRLPARSTLSNWNVERLALSQIQLAEEVSQRVSTTVYSDETSKSGHHYMGFHLSDSDRRFWVLGLCDISSKSAKENLASFKGIFRDTDECIGSPAFDAQPSTSVVNTERVQQQQQQTPQYSSLWQTSLDITATMTDISCLHLSSDGDDATQLYQQNRDTDSLLYHNIQGLQTAARLHPATFKHMLKEAQQADANLNNEVLSSCCDLLNTDYFGSANMIDEYLKRLEADHWGAHDMSCVMLNFSKTLVLKNTAKTLCVCPQCHSH